MNISTKAQRYFNQFEAKKRNDEEDTYICLKNKHSKKLQKAIYKAHGDQLPSDFIYGTFCDLIGSISDCDIETIEDLEDNRLDIVANQCDIYNSDLLKWLASDWDNFETLVESMNSHIYSPDDGAWQVLHTAQRESIDKIMQEVINLLSK